MQTTCVNITMNLTLTKKNVLYITLLSYLAALTLWYVYFSKTGDLQGIQTPLVFCIHMIRSSATSNQRIVKACSCTYYTTVHLPLTHKPYCNVMHCNSIYLKVFDKGRGCRPSQT